MLALDTVGGVVSCWRLRPPPERRSVSAPAAIAGAAHQEAASARARAIAAELDRYLSARTQGPGRSRRPSMWLGPGERPVDGLSGRSNLCGRNKGVCA